MNRSVAIADSLLRQTGSLRVFPMDFRRPARVRLSSSGLREMVLQRGLAISRQTVMNDTGPCVSVLW